MLEEVLRLKNSKEWIEFEKYYNNSNFMERVGFYKYEDPNTNFLYSVLNEAKEIGDIYPFKLLIELIYQKSKGDYFTEIDLLSSYKIDDIKIDPRRTINKLKPDMVIEFGIDKQKYVIVIEAKLNSLERKNQCSDYEKIINENYPDSPDSKYEKVYLFLDKDKAKEISSNSFLRITYNDLVEMLYTPCSFSLKNKDLVMAIEEYMQSFKVLYEQDIKIENIPLSYQGRMLTLNLWNKQEKILTKLFNNDEYLKLFNKNYDTLLRILIINLLKLEDNIFVSSEIKAKIESLVNKTSKKNRLGTRKFNNNDFIYELFKYIISHESIEDINQIPPNVLTTIKNWKNIMSEQEIENSPRAEYYYLTKEQKPLIIGNEKYYPCHSYTGEDIMKIIEEVKKAYPSYEVSRDYTL